MLHCATRRWCVAKWSVKHRILCPELHPTAQEKHTRWPDCEDLQQATIDHFALRSHVWTRHRQHYARSIQPRTTRHATGSNCRYGETFEWSIDNTSRLVYRGIFVPVFRSLTLHVLERAGVLEQGQCSTSGGTPRWAFNLLGAGGIQLPGLRDTFQLK
jgi:hypothetical protein